MGLTFLAYAAGAVAHASGFLAVYVAGVVLGNAKLPHRRAILGLRGRAGLGRPDRPVRSARSARLAGPAARGAGARRWSSGCALVLLARPLSVWVSALAARGARELGWRGQAFLSWAGLRGAVPIVLATIPLSAATPGADGLFDAVFVLVIIFTLVQAGTLAPAARRLGITAPAEAVEIHVETAPLENMHADLLQLDVAPGSRLAGVHIDELRLPVGAAVTLVRAGRRRLRARAGHPAAYGGRPADRRHGRGRVTSPSGGCGR